LDVFGDDGLEPRGGYYAPGLSVFGCTEKAVKRFFCDCESEDGFQVSKSRANATHGIFYDPILGF